MDQSTLVVEWVAVDRLYPNPSNPRLNDAAVPHVASSIRRFGWQQPIVAKRTGEIVAGHTRYKAALQLDNETVPVAWFDGTDLDATAFMIADNRSHTFSEWDDKALAQLLDVLNKEDALDGVGFTTADLDDLIAELAKLEPPRELDDQGPEPLAVRPVSRRGDLWVLGEHRLLCGDACDPSDYGRLLQGESADILWTDPPYGVSYTGGTADKLTIENDDLDGPRLEHFLRRAFVAAIAVCKPGAVVYACAPAGPQFLQFATVLTEIECWRATLVWVKNTFVLGHSDFHYRHENIAYGWVPGGPHHAPPSRDLDSVWEEPKPVASPDHPTSKPVRLVARALEASSDPGEIVLDMFSGGGSTIVAAETTRRRARCIEIDPRYVDAAIRRWQVATGKHATLSGQPFDEVAKERCTNGETSA